MVEKAKRVPTQQLPLSDARAAPSSVDEIHKSVQKAARKEKPRICAQGAAIKPRSV